MLGYAEETKGYRLWNTETKNLLISRDVRFNETVFGNENCDVKQHKTTDEVVYFKEVESLHVPTESEPKNLCNSGGSGNSENITRSEVVQENNENVSSVRTETGSSASPSQAEMKNGTKRDTLKHYNLRNRNVKCDNEKNRVCITNALTDNSVKEPSSYQEAMMGEDAQLWKRAMEEELASLAEHGTWELVDLPLDRKAIGNKWVFRVKYNADGSVERYKARLVAQGFRQKYGIDYTETYSPVASMAVVRLLLSAAVCKDWCIEQMDVTTAYLNGDISEDIYMNQPEGFTIPGMEGKVCKLKKNLYGLKQGGKSWNDKLHQKLCEKGLIRSEVDPCVYYKHMKEGFAIVIVYVDDLLLLAENSPSMLKLKEIISGTFDVKELGPLHFFLNIEMTRCENGEIHMNQRNYIDSILREYKMNDCKPASTPMEPGVKLSKSLAPQTESKKEEMKSVPYKELVGSLMYLVQCTRPDIAYTVSLLGQFASNPGKEHWRAAKHVLRYLKGTENLELVIEKSDGNLHAYTDSDWGACTDDRKSCSGFVLRLNNTAITWKSAKQSCVAMSTMEAEYIALASCAKEVVWVRRLCEELGLSDVIGEATKVKCDNQAAIKFASGCVTKAKSKHIDIRYHFVRSLIKNGQLKIEYVPSEDNIADVLTKALGRPKHQELTSRMGLK